MQLQFAKQGISCLHTIKREVQSQEQTQEFRIPDGMPDIGSIIGAWGQVILRSKEWQSDAMTVTGGTMVWIQYLPEEGGVPQCVESWLPFQMRWSLPQTQHDGTIFNQPLLCGVDARSLSARKMMIRSNVSVLAWAMEQRQTDLYQPVDLPEDVQLLTKTYPMELPVEAGEKNFELEEDFSLPPSAPKMETLLQYSLQPEITEEKLMVDKVVFRGNAQLHVCYLADDGGQYAWDFALPFTQYNELEGEYGEDAQVLLWPCVTALEMEKEEGELHMKAGLLCQYRISNRPLIQVVEDAYSPRRSVNPTVQELSLPGILEWQNQIIHIQQISPMDGLRLTDVQFLPQGVQVHSVPGEATVEMRGQFHVLSYDMEGNLRTENPKWEHTLTVPMGEGASMDATVWHHGKSQGNLMSGASQLTADVNLMTETVCSAPIPMVTALELGELETPDPKRPSLIVRRADGQSLWELAKKNGSTVSSIQQASQLQTEPEDTQMLLIPVM